MTMQSTFFSNGHVNIKQLVSCADELMIDFRVIISVYEYTKSRKGTERICDERVVFQKQSHHDTNLFFYEILAVNRQC